MEKEAAMRKQKREAKREAFDLKYPRDAEGKNVVPSEMEVEFEKDFKEMFSSD